MMHKRTDEFLHREGVTAEQAVEECDFLAGGVHFCLSYFCFASVVLGLFGVLCTKSPRPQPPQQKLMWGALTHRPRSP